MDPDTRGAGSRNGGRAARDARDGRSSAPCALPTSITASDRALKASIWEG
jgi:hypothetical protein